jgi:hypothetical protein
VRRNITANFNGNLNARLDGRADLYLAIPSYTFSTPVLGGQAMIAMAIPYGGSFASRQGRPGDDRDGYPLRRQLREPSARH